MQPLDLLITPAAIPTLAIAAAIVLAGAYVIGRERASGVTLSFLVLTIAVALWLGGISMVSMSRHAAPAIGWAKVAYAGVCSIPAAVFHFTLALTNQLGRFRRAAVAAWIAAAGFAAAFASTDLFITGVYSYVWGFYPRLGAAAIAFLVFFAGLLAAALIALRKAIRSGDTLQQRMRAKSFLIALSIGYLGSIDYLPAFGIGIYPAGYLAIGAFIVLAMRTIRRFRLVDLSASFVAEQLLETMQGGVLAVDSRGTIRLANPAAAALLGYEHHPLVGSDLRGMLRSRHLPATDFETFARAGRTRNRPMVWRRRDGSPIELSVSAEMLRDRVGLPAGILYVVHDLEERRRAERNEFAANHDALTGLGNRVFLASRCDDAIGDAIARGRTTALFFLDLDGFKTINDSYGHAAGDLVLREVAARLRQTVRNDDLLIRFGGDEFIVLSSLGRDADVPLVVGKIERALAGPMTIQGRAVVVSASVGVAVYGRDGMELEELIRAADAAMYAAKRPERIDRESPPPFDRRELTSRA